MLFYSPTIPGRAGVTVRLDGRAPAIPTVLSNGTRRRRSPPVAVDESVESDGRPSRQHEQVRRRRVGVTAGRQTRRTGAGDSDGLISRSFAGADRSRLHEQVATR